MDRLGDYTSIVAGVGGVVLGWLVKNVLNKASAFDKQRLDALQEDVIKMEAKHEKLNNSVQELITMIQLLKQELRLTNKK